MKTIKILIPIIILLTSFICNAQTIKNVVPDTGRQNRIFPIRVNGAGTEWTLSPYFEIYFDSTGVITNNVVIMNDTTLSANIIIDGKAPLGYRKVIVADQFANTYTKDSAFRVLLNTPISPTLIFPFNNSTNVVPNPSLLWDSNAYVSTFRTQIATDSFFTVSSIKFDTITANTPLLVRLGILNYNTKYYWRVSASNSLGTSPWSEIFNFSVGPMAISLVSGTAPDKFRLFENYPNPFNSSTVIKFQIGAKSDTKIRIYDISGKEIALLMQAKLDPGTYNFRFNSGSLSSGIYFYTLETNSYIDTRRMIIIK